VHDSFSVPWSDGVERGDFAGFVESISAPGLGQAHERRALVKRGAQLEPERGPHPSTSAFSIQTSVSRAEAAAGSSLAALDFSAGAEKSIGTPIRPTH
jgi:hypothetical protein